MRIRAAALGIIAAALLVVLLFRLWALQVLHAGQYSAAAVQSQVRTAVVPAQRGDILDRHGDVLVSSRTTIAVQINSATFPAGTDCAGLNRHDFEQVRQRPGCLILWRLAGVIKQRFPRVWKEYSARLAANQGYPITLPFTVTRPEVAYMLERHHRFPSIQFQRTFVRDYPALDDPSIGAVNPNLIGHVGPITAENLKDPAFHGEDLPRIGIAGQAGIEKTYDGWLRGSDGEMAQMFDASGQPGALAVSRREPVTGASVQLKLTIDTPPEGRAGRHPARNPDRPRRPPVLRRLRRDRRHEPRHRRDLRHGLLPDLQAHGVGAAVQGPGGRSVDPKNRLSPAGRQVVRRRRTRRARRSSRSPPPPRGCRASSGRARRGHCTAFYQSPHDLQPPQCSTTGPAARTRSSASRRRSRSRATRSSTGSATPFYGATRAGRSVFQQWIRKLGYGDAPADRRSPRRRQPASSPTRQVEGAQTQRLRGTAPTSVDRQTWDPGDDINMAIGQGYLLVTPLQQAVAYSALENGGKVVTPARRASRSSARPTTSTVPGGDITPGRMRDLHLPPELLTEIKSGLYGATHAGDGTSTSTFGSFQPTVYGKTGTAEVPAGLPGLLRRVVGGLGRAGRPPLVVVAMIHNGGHGGVSAARSRPRCSPPSSTPSTASTSGQDQSR